MQQMESTWTRTTDVVEANAAEAALVPEYVTGD